MSQDEHPTEVRTCTTQGENKGRKQQRARAPLRQPSATAPTKRDTQKREQDNVSILRGSQNIPPETGIHHKTCLKHSNFLNRKLCVQLLPTWNTMATARGQGTEGKTKIRQNELRQGSKHGNYNIFSPLARLLWFCLGFSPLAPWLWFLLYFLSHHCHLGSVTVSDPPQRHFVVGYIFLDASPAPPSPLLSIVPFVIVGSR